MKTLKLNQENKEDVIHFEELLTLSGNWVPDSTSSDDGDIYIKLNRHPGNNYDYYICENTDGEHFIFRCKK